MNPFDLVKRHLAVQPVAQPRRPGRFASDNPPLAKLNAFVGEDDNTGGHLSNALVGARLTTPQKPSISVSPPPNSTRQLVALNIKMLFDDLSEGFLEDFLRVKQ